jgi:hypothetical protein
MPALLHLGFFYLPPLFSYRTRVLYMREKNRVGRMVTEDRSTALIMLEWVVVAAMRHFMGASTCGGYGA